MGGGGLRRSFDEGTAMPGSPHHLIVWSCLEPSLESRTTGVSCPAHRFHLSVPEVNSNVEHTTTTGCWQSRDGAEATTKGDSMRM